MHIEVLVEDSSGGRLLGHLLPAVIGPQGQPHTWRVHSYKGVGRIPPGLRPGSDPTRRILLDQLPRLLRGYSRTQGIDAVLVVLDADNQECITFLRDLRSLAGTCAPALRILFRLAIEEIEAWYLGDRTALLAAYPHAKPQLLDSYQQDSICGTWERLADAIHEGGAAAIIRTGWPLPGQIKHEWAERIGPLMDIERNVSPSFQKFRDGLRRLTGPEDVPSPCG